jgi:hypothetical protein
LKAGDPYAPNHRQLGASFPFCGFVTTVWTLLEQSTPEQLRERTGEQDLGRAFLAIIGQVSR